MADYIKIPFENSLVLKFFNPLFNDIGDYSLPISFNAKDPAINRAFGYPGLPSSNSEQSIPAMIKTSLLDLAGTWEVSEASKERIEAYFKGNGGNFYSLIGEKKLNGLEFGGIKYPVGTTATPQEVLAHMDTKMTAVYPTDDYSAFCAYMPNAYGDDPIDDVKLVNEVEHDELGNPSFKYKYEYFTNDTVYLFAGVVIDYLFAEHGYKIGRNIFRENVELKHLVIFNTYNRIGSNAFDYTKLVPQILCTDFLKALTNRFDIGFFINEKSKTVDIILFDELISSRAKSIRTKFLTKPKINNNRTTGLSFSLNAPDTWSDHTIRGITDFPLHTVVEINKFRDIVPGALTFYNLYFVKAENTYYKIVYVDSVYSAERVCTRNFPYTAGSGGTEVTQYSGIPAMHRYVKNITWTVTEGYPPAPVTYDTDVDFVMPRCDLECTDKNSPSKEFPLMFLFTRGISESYIVPTAGAPESLKYPLGSNDIYDGLGNAVAGASMGLNWGETGGIVESLWTNRINWELNIKKIVKGVLSNDDINELINFLQVDRIENNNYIVNRLEVELSANRVRITEAELFRL